MKVSIEETERRRKIQDAYNKEHGITPKTIKKSVRDVIEATKAADDEEQYKGKSPLELTKKELKEYVKKLEKEMSRRRPICSLNGRRCFATRFSNTK